MRPEDLHIDAALSGFALDYALQQEYIGPLVAPVMNVQKQSDLYWVAGKNALTIHDIQRAPGDEYAKVDWDYSTDPYMCKGYGVKAVVPKELIANADPSTDPSQDAVAAVTGSIMLNAEKRIADKLFSASFITQTSGLTSTARWDSTAPDPWGNRKTANAAVQPATGKKVNTLVLGDAVWEYLRDMTAIKAAIYGDGPKGVPTQEQVASVLGLKNVIVGASSYWDGSKFVDIWGKCAVWAYYPESVSQNQGRIIVPMRTMVWNVDSVGRFQVSAPEWVQSRKSYVHYVDDYTDENVTCAAAAYLFTTVIS
jgi:hypothetical protein